MKRKGEEQPHRQLEPLVCLRRSQRHCNYNVTAHDEAARTISGGIESDGISHQPVLVALRDEAFAYAVVLVHRPAMLRVHPTDAHTQAMPSCASHTRAAVHDNAQQA